MRKLQRLQKQADTRWGFDFPLIEKLADPQPALPGVLEDVLDPKLDARLRRIEYATLALNGEVGELANAVKKIRRGLLQGRAARDIRWEDMQDEVADIFAYLLKLCNEMGWDLEDLYCSKMARNEERFAPAPAKP